MSTKVARLASVPLLKSQLTLIDQPSTGTEVSNEAPETGGWNPYEVWRTRVLLPRLRDKASAEELLKILDPSV